MQLSRNANSDFLRCRKVCNFFTLVKLRVAYLLLVGRYDNFLIPCIIPRYESRENCMRWPIMKSVDVCNYLEVQ